MRPGKTSITAPRFRGAVAAFFALLALLPTNLGASFTSNEDQVLSARMAGASGAWEAGPRIAANALMNPAGLPTRQGSDLMLTGGSPGRRGSGLGAAVLTLPVDETLMLALAYSGFLEDPAAGYIENTASLSAAFELNRWISVGGRYNWHQLEASNSAAGATGGSLDFGVRGRMGLGQRQGMILAVGIRNAASFWADRNWSRAMPVNIKGGLGWSWAGSSWAGIELSRVLPSAKGLDPATLIRAGAEHRFDSGFFASAGASTDPLQRFSCGTGWEGRQLPLGTHYALLVGDDGSLNHRFQVDWAFETRSPPTVSVAPLEIRYEEGTKRVKEAKFAVNVAEDQKAEAWQLEIRDKDGKLIRIIEGTGTPPGYVSWDGRDNSGAWVDDGDKVSYKLNIKTPGGEASSRPLLAGDMTVGASALSALSLDASNNQSSLPALLPVFGEDGKEVDHFMIKMPSAEGPLSKWKVLIKDSQGNVLQAIEGSGPMPTELSWDGKNKEGMRINDTSNLQISLVSVDLSGKASEISGSVYSQAGLALDWGDDHETRLSLRIAPFSPGGQSWEMSLSDATLKPMPVPKAAQAPQIALARPAAVPTRRPTALPAERPTEAPAKLPTAPPTERPTVVPTLGHTMQPSPISTEAPQPLPTPEATAAPTPRPTPQPTEVAPYQVLSSKPQIRIRSRLGGGRMAFAFLPPPEAAPSRGPAKPLSAETLKRLVQARTPYVVDVFEPGSAKEEKRLEGRVNAAYERYRGLGFKQIRLTGLVKSGEAGAEGLSRARAVRMSELLSKKGFKGEFVIWVKGEPGKEKGVRIEVLR